MTATAAANVSAARENWIWHSFRELAGVSGGVSIAAL
jgi:hypothetical protein